MGCGRCLRTNLLEREPQGPNVPCICHLSAVRCRSDPHSQRWASDSGRCSSRCACAAGSMWQAQHNTGSTAKRPCPHQLQGMPRPVSCGFVANRPVGSRLKRQKQRSLGACAVLLCPHRIGNIQARDNELRDSDASACGTWTCQPCKAAGLSLETVTCRPLMATCCGTV